jgi:hydroxyacylglutathione hydrolase
VACPETREAMVIDPGEPCRELEATIDDNGFRPVLIAITHDHFDHTGGIQSLVDRYGAEVVARRGSICGVRTRAVAEGDHLKVGSLDVTVLETPGHTPDSISLAVGDAVFTGDALFAGSVGGTSSRENFDEEIENIRTKILSHSQAVRVFPGHGPPSTIAVEATFNPFL